MPGALRVALIELHGILGAPVVMCVPSQNGRFLDSAQPQMNWGSIDASTP